MELIIHEKKVASSKEIEGVYKKALEQYQAPSRLLEAYYLKADEYFTAKFGDDPMSVENNATPGRPLYARHVGENEQWSADSGHLGDPDMSHHDDNDENQPSTAPSNEPQSPGQAREHQLFALEQAVKQLRVQRQAAVGKITATAHGSPFETTTDWYTSLK